MHRPESSEALAALIVAAAGEGRRLDLRGGGTREDFGAPCPDAEPVIMTRLAGIEEYDPAELVLTAGAGTPLADIRAAVAERGQHLAFEPYGAAGSTIGGVVASATSGSRRVSAGAARDHLLGFHAVSGRGEPFVAGAKVVKNVTGYDLSKVMCGSWGRLAALTQVTLKVLPAPPEGVTLAWTGLASEPALALLRSAMRLAADVAAAAHDPMSGRTLLRIEGFGPSVTARQTLVARALAANGAPEMLSEADARAAWRRLEGAAALADAPVLWRISVQPRLAGQAAARLCSGDSVRWLADWAGGLIWLAGEEDAARVRTAARDAGGHAALMRAGAAMRAEVPALHPQAPALAALEARMRRAFDPAGVFETGRFAEPAHAD